MKQICIGIPVHAEPGRLRATLDSLRSSPAVPFEMVLLPDGPDAATQEVLERLRDIPQTGTETPCGTSACFNRLIGSCDADIFVLLESGVVVGPRWLESVF